MPIKILTSIVIASLVVSQSAAPILAQQPTPAPAPQATAQPQDTSKPPADLILREGTDVPLVFDQDISSKTAGEGDEVVFVLAEDLKVGDVVVAKAGAKAVGEVTNAKKSGMMGKAGELNIRINYLKVGDIKIHLRGSKGKEGESGTTGAIVLTVLFGPIGLIKHGKNIDIKKGTAMKVYVSEDIKVIPLQ
jgi:hypothetical protein